MIKSDNQLTSILGGTNGMTTLDVWKPFLKDAEKLHIVPAIGQTFYDYLNTLVAIDDYGSDIEVTATPAEIAILENLRLALANYADLYSTQRLGMINGDGGKADVNPNYTASSPKWKYSSTLEMVRDKADKYLELALGNLVNNPDEYPTYIASEAFTKNAQMLIYSADRLTEFFPNCRGSHRFYLFLRDQLWVEQKRMVGLLSIPFYADVLAQNAKLLKGETVTAQHQKVIEMLCKLIVSKAIVAAIPYINVGEDWRYKTNVGGLEEKSLLSDTNRSEIKLQESQAADNARSALIEYLNSTATDLVLPIYFNSTAYIAPVENQVSGSSFYKNDPEAKYVVL